MMSYQIGNTVRTRRVERSSQRGRVMSIIRVGSRDQLVICWEDGDVETVSPALLYKTDDCLCAQDKKECFGLHIANLT